MDHSLIRALKTPIGFAERELTHRHCFMALRRSGQVHWVVQLKQAMTEGNVDHDLMQVHQQRLYAS